MQLGELLQTCQLVDHEPCPLLAPVSYTHLDVYKRQTEREALKPLHSLWIDLLVLRLLNEPKEGQKRVWFVIDELASLQKLPQLHTAITENRKSNNPVILGFQGKAQLEVLDVYKRQSARCLPFAAMTAT